MKALTLLSLAVAVVLSLAGCGGPKLEVKGENGETVKMDTKGNMSVTDKDGKTASITRDGDKTTVTDDKGGVATMEGKDGSMKVSGPDGKMEMSKDSVTEAELGLPFYPGSVSVNSQKVDVNGKSQFLTMRTTKDDPKKVAEFYKEKFKVESNANSGVDGNEMAILSGKLPDGRKVALSASQNRGEETNITLSVAKE